jgi:hypothetical protein
MERKIYRKKDEIKIYEKGYSAGCVFLYSKNKLGGER